MNKYDFSDLTHMMAMLNMDSSCIPEEFRRSPMTAKHRTLATCIIGHPEAFIREISLALREADLTHWPYMQFYAYTKIRAMSDDWNLPNAMIASMSYIEVKLLFATFAGIIMRDYTGDIKAMMTWHDRLRLCLDSEKDVMLRIELQCSIKITLSCIDKLLESYDDNEKVIMCYVKCKYRRLFECCADLAVSIKSPINAPSVLRDEFYQILMFITSAI